MTTEGDHGAHVNPQRRDRDGVDGVRPVPAWSKTIEWWHSKTSSVTSGLDMQASFGLPDGDPTIQPWAGIGQGRRSSPHGT